MKVIYVFGVPGAGKSTLEAAVCEPFVRHDVAKPFAHRMYHDGERFKFIALGRIREAFSGTDTLGMSVGPTALAWLTERIEGGLPILGEGDRLGYGKFWKGLSDAGAEVWPVLLDTPGDVAAERRDERGSAQSETWLKGRTSKVEGLRREAAVILDGRRPTAELADEMRRIFPELRA